MAKEIVHIFEIKETVELRAEIPYGDENGINKIRELIREKNGQKLYEVKYVVFVSDIHGDGTYYFLDENLEETEILDFEWNGGNRLFQKYFKSTLPSLILT